MFELSQLAQDSTLESLAMLVIQQNPSIDRDSTSVPTRSKQQVCSLVVITQITIDGSMRA